MANEWNTSYPLDHTLISGVPGEIRALKASVKTQLDRSHETPVDGDATGSEHSSGSGVAFEGTSTPTNRPDGATALANNAIDRGRLWLDDNYDPPRLRRWDGSAFESLMTPGDYAGEQSITFPNGAILKMGAETVAANTTDEVTYAVAFPTSADYVMCSYRGKDVALTDAANVQQKSGSEDTILEVSNPQSSQQVINWQAWGH